MCNYDPYDQVSKIQKIDNSTVQEQYIAYNIWMRGWTLLYNMKLPSIPLIFSTEWRLNQTVQYFYKTVQ